MAKRYGDAPGVVCLPAVLCTSQRVASAANAERLPEERRLFLVGVRLREILIDARTAAVDIARPAQDGIYLRLRDVRPALDGLPGRGHIKQRQLFGYKKGTGACVRLLRRFPLRFP